MDSNPSPVLELHEGPQLKKLKKQDERIIRVRVPDGWVGCPEFGKDISFIIPSKVPLSQSFNQSIPPGSEYSFDRVFRRLSVNRIRLGLVVDLTNTDRYYDSYVELEKRGVGYLKIRCQGRDSVPDNESVNVFVFEVLRFMSDQRDRTNGMKKYVFVHCTHGYNRTGFMLVHYMMQTRQVSSVTEAIQMFAKARPPGIYKKDYIDSLYSFYHEMKPDLVVCPSTPEWKRETSFDDKVEVSSNGSDVCNDGAVVVMTNDDVLGDRIPNRQELKLWEFCYRMLKLPSWAKGFPGSHPVSLNIENLRLLRQRVYYATWKADGTRYMMLICAHGTYLIDRKFTFRRVQMRFPCRKTGHFLHDTLLDGEMVIDSFSPDNKQERRFLIYDMIAINGVSIVDRPFYQRWKMVKEEIIEPRNLERSQGLTSPYRYDLEPFRVRRKDFWLLSTVGKILKDFIPKLSHESDGLIFQGCDDVYVPRTHEGLLKWKYPKMNSVDFQFEIGKDGLHQLYLYQKGQKQLELEGSRVCVLEEGVDPVLYAGKIIECWFDAVQNAWVFMRFRTDKSTPNERNTYMKVMTSIKDNITEQILLNEINDIIGLPIYAR